MVQITHGDYNTPMSGIEGLEYYPNAEGLRMGFEYETGWHDFDERHAFFQDIEKAGLANRLMSKFDRSITAAWAAELVSVPLAYTPLHNLTADLGPVIEKHSTRMTLKGCGVHVHLTKAALVDPVLWKLLQALTASPSTIGRWSGELKRKGSKESGFIWQKVETLSASKSEALNAASEHINMFWSLVALRHDTQHCNRYGWDTLVDFKNHEAGDHKRGVITAAKTPTVEIRLFRSARSRIVLCSYIEVVEALTKFCGAPSAEAEDAGWPGGTFPVNAFVAYIHENKHLYPAISKRLRLAKFAAYSNGAIKPKLFADHISEKHGDLRAGCFIEDDGDPFERRKKELSGKTGEPLELGRRPTWVIIAPPDDDPDTPLIVRRLQSRLGDAQMVLGRSANIPSLLAVHTCPGAESTGVFE